MDVSHGKFNPPPGVTITGTGTLPSAFDVSGLAVSAMARAAAAVARLAAHHGAEPATISLDRDLAALWFGMSFTPVGWKLPPAWDAIAGDYRCADGRIRLHTNAPHHRTAALKVLGLGAGANRETVASAVELWVGEELEAAVVAAQGCAALMRLRSQWLAHGQGSAVAAEPLVAWGAPRLMDDGGTRHRVWSGTDWEEPALEAEMTVDKRCARLNLKTPEGLAVLQELLDGADIFIHGYRPDALDRLGLSEDILATAHPTLVNVALDAYGWSGPWANRRGFDALVQMSCGIAHAGLDYFGSDRFGSDRPGSDRPRPPLTRGANAWMGRCETPGCHWPGRPWS